LLNSCLFCALKTPFVPKIIDIIAAILTAVNNIEHVIGLHQLQMIVTVATITATTTTYLPTQYTTNSYQFTLNNIIYPSYTAISQEKYFF